MRGPDPSLNPPEKSIPNRKLNTHSVLLPQLLVQSGAHNLSLDRGRSGEVGLSALATVVSDGCEIKETAKVSVVLKCFKLRRVRSERAFGGK